MEKDCFEKREIAQVFCTSPCCNLVFHVSVLHSHFGAFLGPTGRGVSWFLGSSRKTWKHPFVCCVIFFFFLAPQQPGWTAIVLGSFDSLVCSVERVQTLIFLFPPVLVSFVALSIMSGDLNYIENVDFFFFFFLTSILTGGAQLMSSFFIGFFLHNLTNKMNVGVWALTFWSEKQHVCFFVSGCLYFRFRKKKDVFSALWRVLKVNTFRSGFHFFH